MEEDFHFRSVLIDFNSTFAPSESEGQSEKDQRKSDKHQRKFSLSLPLSLGVNGPYLGVFSILTCTW